MIHRFMSWLHGRRLAPDAPAAVAPARRGISISHRAMMQTEPKHEVRAWGPPELPKGVIPEKRPADMAMDDTGFAGAYAYANLGQYGSMFPGYPFLAELAQKPEYRKISEIPAKEATRKWIKLIYRGDDDATEKLAQLENAMKRFNVRSLFRDAMECDGFFGRAQIYIDVMKPGGGLASDDRDELMTPLLRAPAKIKKGSLVGFKLIEPLWTYPYVFNADRPMRPDFYKPNSWFVMGTQIHASRLLFFCARPVPDILKPAYNFGGMSLSQLAAPYIENWLRTRDSVSDLIHAFSTSGIKTNLGEVLNQGGAEQMMMRAEIYNRMRDNRGVLMIDKETEEFFQFNTPLSGLDQLQTAALQQIAMPANIPLVKLLGTTPAGLNSDSEEEVRVFYDYVHSVQEDIFTGPLTDVIDIIQLSEFGEVDPLIGFEYVPLMQLTDKELSEVRKSDGDRAVALINAGVISPEEERARLAADPLSGYDGIDPDDVPEPPEPPPMMGSDPSDQDDDPTDPGQGNGPRPQ